MPTSAVGVYLGEIRRGRDLTQEELARQLKVSIRTVRNIETGAHPPQSDTLLNVIDILQASPHHVARLRRAAATTELAKYLAQLLLAGRSLSDEDIRALETMTSEQLRALIGFAGQFEPPRR